MIASESTAFTFDRTERFCCNALRKLRQPRSDHAGRRSDFDVIVIGDFQAPIDCTTLISVQRIQKKQPTAHPLPCHSQLKKLHSPATSRVAISAMI